MPRHCTTNSGGPRRRTLCAAVSIFLLPFSGNGLGFFLIGLQVFEGQEVEAGISSVMEMAQVVLMEFLGILSLVQALLVFLGMSKA